MAKFLDNPTKRFRNDDTGEEQLFTKINGKWIPAVEAQQAQDAESINPLQAGLIGAGRNVSQTVEGIKDLFTGNTERDESADQGYAALKEAHPVATTAGEIASEIGQIAVPAGALAKTGKVAPVLADIAASAGLGYLRRPGEDEDREGAALLEGALAAGGGALGRLATGIFKPSEAAKTIRELGGYLTPGQASAGPLAHGLEQFVGRTGIGAGLGSTVHQATTRGADDWLKIVADQAKAPGSKVKIKSGDDMNKVYDEITEEFSNKYQEAFSGLTEIPDPAIDMLKRRVSNILPTLSKTDQSVLRKLNNQIKVFEKAKKAGKGNPARQAAVLNDEIGNALRNAVATKRQNPDLVNELMEMKKAYRNSMPGDIGNKLGKLDEQFPAKLTLDKAVAKATSNTKHGRFTPRQGMAASGQVDKKKLPRGKSPLFDILQAGADTIGKPSFGRPFDMGTRVIAEAGPVIPGAQVLGNILSGGNVAQMAADKHLPDFLKEILSPAKLSAAAIGEDDENRYMTMLSELGL